MCCLPPLAGWHFLPNRHSKNARAASLTSSNFHWTTRYEFHISIADILWKKIIQSPGPLNEATSPKRRPRMKTSPAVALVFVLFQAICLLGTQPGDAAEATICRDEFGIPHVFAPNLESAAYAVGYA